MYVCVLACIYVCVGVYVYVYGVHVCPLNSRCTPPCLYNARAVPRPCLCSCVYVCVCTYVLCVHGTYIGVWFIRMLVGIHTHTHTHTHTQKFAVHMHRQFRFTLSEQTKSFSNMQRMYSRVHWYRLDLDTMIRRSSRKGINGEWKKCSNIVSTILFCHVQQQYPTCIDNL